MRTRQRTWSSLAWYVTIFATLADIVSFHSAHFPTIRRIVSNHRRDAIQPEYKPFRLGSIRIQGRPACLTRWICCETKREQHDPRSPRPSKIRRSHPPIHPSKPPPPARAPPKAKASAAAAGRTAPAAPAAPPARPPGASMPDLRALADMRALLAAVEPLLPPVRPPAPPPAPRRHVHSPQLSPAASPLRALHIHNGGGPSARAAAPAPLRLRRRARG